MMNAFMVVENVPFHSIEEDTNSIMYNNPLVRVWKWCWQPKLLCAIFHIIEGVTAFFDNPSSRLKTLEKVIPEKMRVTFFSGELNVYVIFGDTPAEILKRYHELTELKDFIKVGSWQFHRVDLVTVVKNRFLTLLKNGTEKIPLTVSSLTYFLVRNSIKGSLEISLGWIKPNGESQENDLHFEEKNKKTIPDYRTIRTTIFYQLRHLKAIPCSR